MVMVMLEGYRFLAKFLSNYKIQVDLYAELNKVSKFLNIDNLNNINLINFDSKTTEKDFKLGKQKMVTSNQQG